MKKVRWHFILFWVALFTFWYTAPTEGMEEPITIQVSPRISVAPAGKRVRVRAAWKIAPHEENVYYSFSYSSLTGATSGSSMKKMDEYSSIHYERFVDLPVGEYIFQACVVRNERPKPKTYCADTTAEVR